MKISRPVSDLPDHVHTVSKPRLLREVCSPPQVMDQCLPNPLALVVFLLVAPQMVSSLRLLLAAGPPKPTSCWIILFACSII